jgi:hypothetical protein
MLAGHSGTLANVIEIEKGLHIPFETARNRGGLDRGDLPLMILLKHPNDAECAESDGKGKIAGQRIA